MPNRTIVITGATDGLGRALSGALAHRPATTLILHGRNQSRLDELATTLADAPASIHTVRADFSELTQVHRLADEITEFTDHIAVLVNNAGIGGGEPDGTNRRLTVDGHELRFAVNHLARPARWRLPHRTRRRTEAGTGRTPPARSGRPVVAAGRTGTRGCRSPRRTYGSRAPCQIRRGGT
ncbi:SDR family NAD(P)-dependent oxidoreductase [Streptomyces sp. NPDC001393]